MTRSLIIGAGSIGLRHHEILSELGHSVAWVTSRADLKEKSYSTVQDGLSDFKPSYVVISNATSSHQSAFLDLIHEGYQGKTLVEKPLAFEPATLAAATWGDSSRIGVAYNLRFHPIVVAARTYLTGKKVLAAEVYAGQHLETWRPNRPVSSQYSSFAEKGGGVLRDLAHELDLIQMLFGEVIRVTALGGRISNLTIDSDDAWAILMKTESVSQISLQLNYFDKPGARFLRIQTETETLSLDLLKAELRINDNLELSVPHERNLTYRLMHEDMLSNGGECSTLREASNVDTLIEDIELSSIQKCWISR